MFLHTFSYVTSYILAFCSLIALLLVIPQASAASNRLKPGWRAWVWPLAFLGLLLKNITEANAILQKLDASSLFWQVGDLAICFSLTMLVLNSLHRGLDVTGAHRLTLLAWGLYLLLSLLIVGLQFSPSLLIYEALAVLGLILFYTRLYYKNQDRASDALPVMAGIIFLLVYSVFQAFPFKLDLGPFALDQSVISHLAGILGLYFLYKGASSSYTLKYAAQRRRERDHPALNHKPE